MRCPLPLRLVLAAAVLAAALGVGVPGQAAESVEPNREQLQLQIDIMQDYIKKLESNTTKQGEAVDPVLAEAQKSALLREYQYSREKYDILIAGYTEQRTANRIVLGLVVLVVAAGIVFSAYQLWKGVGPAAAPGLVGAPEANTRDASPASDVEVSLSKIRITSTVIGIIVLVISIAFFYIYTKELTSIHVVGISGTERSDSSK